MPFSKVLFAIATVLFGVAFVLVFVGGGGPRTEVGLLYLGLTTFAAGHFIP